MVQQIFKVDGTMISQVWKQYTQYEYQPDKPTVISLQGTYEQ